MKHMRLKLLAPTLLAAGLAVAGLVGATAMDNRLRASTTRERDTRMRAAFADAVQSGQQQIANAAKLLGNDDAFLVAVAAADAPRIRQALAPMCRDLGISLLGVYDRSGALVVRVDLPPVRPEAAEAAGPVAAKPPPRPEITDDLGPLAQRSLAGIRLDDRLTSSGGLIQVITVRNLGPEPEKAPVGTLVVGVPLDRDFAERFSSDQGVHLAISGRSGTLLTSRGWRQEWATDGEWRPDLLPLPLLLDTDLTVTVWRNTVADNLAAYQRWAMLAVLGGCAGVLIWISHRLIRGTVVTLDRARRAAQAAERRVAEIEARRNDAFLQGMIADSPIACVVVDGGADTVLYANRRFAELWQLAEAAEDLRGKMTIGALAQRCSAVAADPPAFTAAFAELARHGETRTVDDEVVLRDGRIAHRFSAPIKDADGRHLGRVFLFEDITARKRYEGDLIRAKEDAEAANRAKGDFLSVMSHELRTPLNGVIGLGHVLADTELDSQQRECVETIVSCGRHLLTVISDILDFSKIDAGRMAVERVPVDLRSLIDSTGNLIAEQARAKRLDLRTAVADAVPARLLGDPQRLRQVLLNLLSNAVKFTERGSVVLSAAAEDGRLRLRVQDTGIGIDPEAQARLFAPFIQADSSTSRRYGGTGLGLAISRRLVELMGGGITLTSRAGEGSVFTIDLPLEATDPGASTGRISSAKRGGLVGGMRVLVVEDDAVNRMVARRLLEGIGCAVSLAADGAAALERQRQEGDRFDLVLLDLQMPGMDGLACARAWRLHEQQHGSGRVPILALTAAVQDDDRAATAAAGMDGHLSKPVDPEELATAVRRFIPVRS